MMRRLLLIGIACGLGTSMLLARPGIVTLSDGQRIEGEIIQDNPTSVVVEIRGIRTEIARERVTGVTYTEGFEAEYNKRLAALEPDDAAGRVALARWAFENREYATAQRTLDDVLQNVDPNSREATELLALVRAQRQLERNQERAPRGGENGAVEVDPQPPVEGEQVEIHYLGSEEIKRIKAAEASAERREPEMRLRIPEDVLREFLRATQMNPRQFQGLSEVEKLRRLNETVPVEMMERVEVRGDPATMSLFRTRIQPIILNGCATSGCHNTPVGGFMLYPRGDRSEAATYTNFYILQQYTQSGEAAEDAGLFAAGARERKMIDRTTPANSLLLQYALPAARNRASHPEVQGYRGMMRGTNDPRYAQILGWIRSLEPFEPDYGIDYVAPGAEVPETPEAPPAPEAQPEQPAPADRAAPADRRAPRNRAGEPGR